MTLNVGQSTAYDVIQNGGNILILGGGGVGKTYLINRVRKDFGHETIFMSTTGITAVDIGGSTAHRTLALPLGFPESGWLKHVTKAFAKIWRNKAAVKRIVLDEVSMCRSDTFTCIDYRLRSIYRTDKPFGGLQVIISGDIFQLPPVVKFGTSDYDMIMEEYGSEFFFHTDSFLKGNFKVVSLTESMRTEDKEMKYYLDCLRFGENLDEAISFFNTREIPFPKDSHLITITTTNKIADRGNAKVFKRNTNPAWTYQGVSTGVFSDKDKSVPDVLQLKDGLRVMALMNTETYKNGSVGTVIMCCTEYVVVHFDGDKNPVQVRPSTWENFDTLTKKVRADTVYSESELEHLKVNGTDVVPVVARESIGSFQQIPLKQCSFITAHKSQGASLDGAIIDLGFGAFAAGQAYTMFSRLRGMSKMYLDRPLYKSDIIVCREALEFYKEHAEAK